MILAGTKRKRRKARRVLTILFIHPSGRFRVTGGRRAHEVQVTSAGRGFVYDCDNGQCPGGEICSHVLAVMAHLEPERVSAQIL